MRPIHKILAVVITLALAVPVFSAMFVDTVRTNHLVTNVDMQPDDAVHVTCNGAFNVPDGFAFDPGTVEIECHESSNTVGDPTATATVEATATDVPPPPDPTATEVEPTTTPTEPVGGHDTSVWHGPQGHTHEHGKAPPSWLPTSGPCANIHFEQMAAGREHHNFYKGYEGVTSNGVRFYIVNHIAPTIAGRSHGDHDETIIALDTSGNVSCWQGIGHYSPTNDPTDPIDIHVKACGAGGPQGPIILVDCGLSSESWYQRPGAGWCDNTTHVNGVFEDVNGANRGDGGSRHVEISCYASRLPDRGSPVHVAPTLAQDCVVQFGVCQFKSTTSFAFDYTLGLSLSGPN